MKYKALVRFLHSLILVKRSFWWLGSKFSLVLAKFFGKIWRFFAFFNYKIEYFFRRMGWGKDRAWWLKRDNLQIILFLVLFFSALPQTKLFTKDINDIPGHGTVAYSLFGPGEDYGVEELAAVDTTGFTTAAPSWRTGAVGSDMASYQTDMFAEQGLGMLAAGGSAIVRPSILPGTAVIGQERRTVVEYTIEPGDSLGNIAYRFGVSVATILWENNLGVNSIIRPGEKIRIPPTTGVMHAVKKGDTIKKIATAYGVKPEEIIKFNNLKEDGTDLVIGEKIMVPGGVKAEARTYSTVPQTYSSFQKIAAPASSKQSPGSSGYVWPSAARIITQYYSWRHLGLDVAGPLNSANYAARAGTVTKSQCGWNNGYGCVIMIDHGNGVVTLYGHNNKLLVNVGEYVTTGQTIGLMGNTGNVRGRTGIHLHFEVRVNGSRVNPLKYVK